VSAVASTTGALPIPAPFENSPRAMSSRIAIMIARPASRYFSMSRLMAMTAIPPAMHASTSWLCPYLCAVGSSSSIEM